ncbi:MAG: prepilin-type N-terminal cleavage/methylation domain-containing protein [Anaerovoracaceae bacterium]
MKAIRNKKGMTLVEVIVGLVILLIILGVAISVLLPVMKTFFRTEEGSETQMISKNIVTQVRREINRASSIKVTDGNLEYKLGESEEARIIKVDQNGYLEIGGQNPLSPDYYKGRTISMSFVSAGTNKVDIKLKVKYQDREYLSEATLSPTVSAFSVASQFGIYEEDFKYTLDQVINNINVNPPRQEAIIKYIEDYGTDEIPTIEIDGKTCYWLPYHLKKWNSKEYELVYYAAYNYGKPPINHCGWKAYAIMANGETYMPTSGDSGSAAGFSGYNTIEALLNSDYFKNQFKK